MVQNLERVRYFFGKLLSVDDFQEEQSYFLNRLRRHNRFLHGWGVVSGLDVKISRAKEIVISAGLAIDCAGNEIAVAEPLGISLGAAKGTRYVAIRYKEEDVCPVPAGTEIEHSRIREGAEVLILDVNPGTGHRGIGPGTPGCGHAHPLCLAKLTWHGSRWQLRKLNCRA
jgi:hypothetical protein